MQIEDHTDESTDPYAPRPRASQAVAAAHRAAADAPDPIAPATRPALPFGIGAAILIVLMIGMATWQLSVGTARPLAIPPAATTRSAFSAPPTAAPAPTAAPPPTAAPTAPPVPTEGPQNAPQTGRGMTFAPTAAPEAAPAAEPPAAAPSYLDNVGAQAPHSPRGGLCGPASGDCAPGVPYGLENSQYIANVGAQAPHKVR